MIKPEELTANQVKQIRRNLRAGLDPTTVALMFSIRRKDVRDIGAGRSWEWVR